MRIATTSTNKVQQAYIAYYGRPADPGGLAHWVGQLDKGVTFDVMLQAFGTSDEAITLFGNKTSEATIQTLFQQILGRTPDADGLAFYVGKLKDGSMTGITIAQNVFDGATGGDATMVANKLAVAKAFNTALNTTEKKAAYAGAAAVVTLRDMHATVNELTDPATFDVVTTVTGLLVSVAVNSAYEHRIDVFKGALTTDQEIAASDKVYQDALDIATAAGATDAEIFSAYNIRLSAGFDSAVVVYKAAVVASDATVVTAATSKATAVTTATEATAFTLALASQAASATAATDATAVVASAAAVTAAVATLKIASEALTTAVADAPDAPDAALAAAAVTAAAAAAALPTEAAAFDAAEVMHDAAVVAYEAAVVTAATSKAVAAEAATNVTTLELANAFQTAATIAMVDAAAVVAAAAVVTAAAATLKTSSAATQAAADDATAAVAVAAAAAAATAATAATEAAAVPNLTAAQAVAAFELANKIVNADDGHSDLSAESLSSISTLNVSGTGDTSQATFGDVGSAENDGLVITATGLKAGLVMGDISVANTADLSIDASGVTGKVTLGDITGGNVDLNYAGTGLGLNADHSVQAKIVAAISATVQTNSSQPNRININAAGDTTALTTHVIGGEREDNITIRASETTTSIIHTGDLAGGQDYISIDGRTATGDLTLSVSGATNYDDSLLKSGVGDDTINGGEGVDLIDGGAGDDTIDGGTDDDLIFVNQSTEGDSDIMDGGDGEDILSLAGASHTFAVDGNLKNIETIIVAFDVTTLSLAGQTENFAVGLADVTGDALALTTGAGDLTFSDGDASDTITVIGMGTSGQSLTSKAASNFHITAGDNAQTITTGAGADTIFGGKGKDQLNGGKGNDIINGGKANDIIIVSESAAGDSDEMNGGDGEGDELHLSGGSHKFNTDANLNNIEKIKVFSTVTALSLEGQSDQFAIELVNAQSNALTLTTGTGDLTFNGGDASDTITVAGMGTANQELSSEAANSSFHITAGEGKQIILTGVGNDIIDGGPGADSLTGGDGADSLTGGDGADTFVFASGHTGITLETADTITDFKTGVDFIDHNLNFDLVRDPNGVNLANFSAFIAAANAGFGQFSSVKPLAYFVPNAAGLGDAWIVIDEDLSNSVNTGDTVIILTGINSLDGITSQDFI